MVTVLIVISSEQVPAQIRCLFQVSTVGTGVGDGVGVGDARGEVGVDIILCVVEGVSVAADFESNVGLGINQINTDQITAMIVQRVARPTTQGWERPFINFFITVDILTNIHVVEADHLQPQKS